MARKEKNAGAWSASGLTAVDVVHLLSQVLGGKDKGDGADAIESMLAGVFASADVESWPGPG